jgi:murein DD-endopeptidase MepM/ murein hydrolase activator NlpD
MRIPLLVLLLASIAAATPRADHRVINLVNRQAEFEAMVERVEPLVLAHGKARPDEREALTDRVVSEVGRDGIEVLVRYREPHLIPVFARLADHEDWFVRRLAVFALQRNLALSELDRAVARLGDENGLVRETAATTVAILHFAGKKHRKMVPRTKVEAAARKGLAARRKDDLGALKTALEKEKDPYVAASLRLAVETLGKRPLLRIHEEPVVGRAPVRRVPRTVGGEVNAYQKGSGYSGSGSGRLKPTSGWAYPTLLYPREVMQMTSDRPLVPLPKKANSLHFGHDCAWFLEGSTVYAIGDGIVRWIRSGGDWGGLVVVEYLTEKGEKVVGLNGHCGMWVFVKPGERVAKGQAIAQIGLSFSPENGGHGAHDHFGMYEGAFAEGRCYGRSGAGKSVEGWIEPPVFLTPRVSGKTIAPDSYR